MNPSVKDAAPMKKIWYPDVALATRGFKLKVRKTPMIKVPDPTPRMPCTSPAVNPPRPISPNIFCFDKSKLKGISSYLYKVNCSRSRFRIKNK